MSSGGARGYGRTRLGAVRGRSEVAPTAGVLRLILITPRALHPTYLAVVVCTEPGPEASCKEECDRGGGGGGGVVEPSAGHHRTSTRCAMHRQPRGAGGIELNWNTVRVQGLDKITRDHQIHELFSSVGRVARVVMGVDKVSSVLGASAFPRCARTRSVGETRIRGYRAHQQRRHRCRRPSLPADPSAS